MRLVYVCMPNVDFHPSACVPSESGDLALRRTQTHRAAKKKPRLHDTIVMGQTAKCETTRPDRWYVGIWPEARWGGKKATVGKDVPTFSAISKAAPTFLPGGRARVALTRDTHGTARFLRNGTGGTDSGVSFLFPWYTSLGRVLVRLRVREISSPSSKPPT